MNNHQNTHHHHRRHPHYLLSSSSPNHTLPSLSLSSPSSSLIHHHHHHHHHLNSILPSTFPEMRGILYLYDGSSTGVKPAMLIVLMVMVEDVDYRSDSKMMMMIPY
jgi:hypothetical protein